MIIVALVIGLVLIASAIRNTQGALFTALGTDLPAYVVWAAALVAIGAIGFLPGLKTPSRYLLALVVLVLILNNYQAILSGFATVSTPSKTAATPSGGTAPAVGTQPPAASASAATSAGANLFGVSPSASDFGQLLGETFATTTTDAANSFAGMITGSGP